MNNAQNLLEQSTKFFTENIFHKEILTKISNNVYIAKNEAKSVFILEQFIMLTNRDNGITLIDNSDYLMFNFADNSSLIISGLIIVIVEHEKRL